MRINPTFLKTAIYAARKGGKILERRFRKPTKINIKKDFSLVSKVDLDAEKEIVKVIRNKFPFHNIVSEEKSGEIKKGFNWILDPLDGTTNYILGIPFFCTALALLKDEKLILSVIFNPLTKELYFAEKGKGAFLNKKKINVNRVDELQKSLLVFNKGKDVMGGFKFLTKLAPHIRTFRFFGAVSLEMCQVAVGNIEGLLSSKLPLHDSIPGILLVEEAKGRITDFKGRNWMINSEDLFISNKKIHNQVLKLIKSK